MLYQNLDDFDLSKVIIRKPRNDKEYEEYYRLRYEVLRKPWGQPFSVDSSEEEKNSIHICALIDNNIVGVARGHYIDKETGQIRYMAVNPDFSGKGIGRKIVIALEKELSKKQIKKIILQSREKAVGFYLNLGYKIFADGILLFNEIPHFWMEKVL